MAAVAIRGTTYPVVLPKLRDPRLHLAATITSLQVLGQVAFHFRLSIAQILVSLATVAVLEVAITAWKQRVLMWPASALLTGNGVAFVLRVPGTPHGAWWSVHGWWIYVATAGGALLSKYVLAWRGEHVFNPSNIGLVVVFLILGRTQVEPLDFWWGPMSWWTAIALAIIVIAGFTILRRLALLRVALSFWAAFALGIGGIALAGHAMTARWHLGPIQGLSFWWVLVTSPEVLVFLFFMITDPRTAPRDLRMRMVYGVTLGLLASLLIAPTTTEFAAKVALLSALAIVCVAKALLQLHPVRVDRTRLVAACAVAVAAYAGVAVFGNNGARSAAPPLLPHGVLPPITILPSPGVQTRLDRTTAERIAFAVVAGHPAPAGQTLSVQLVPGTDQSPPTAVARLAAATYRLRQTGAGSWAIAHRPGTGFEAAPSSSALRGTQLVNVARSTGLGFRQGSFRFGVSNDVRAMMGGGVCWLDYNGDGRLDLFAVNSYAGADAARWQARGGLPTSALFENVGGRFRDVTARAHAGLAVQGDGCAAGDLDGDGRTDLVVTTTTGVDALWNTGHGRFALRRLPGPSGWYTGVAIADVDGDGRPDVFTAGYADPNHPVPTSIAGFPTNLTGVRDLLFRNDGRRAFREIGVRAGLEAASFRHGLGAQFMTAQDGRSELYVANDEDPNQLYVDVRWPGGRAADPAGLGFRFEERASVAGVADPFAGMGIATSGSRLLVTNSRGEPSAAYRRQGTRFLDARSKVAPALGTGFAGWGASWVDLRNTGRPDLVLAAGAIPVTNLARDAERVRVLAPTTGGAFGDATSVLGKRTLRVNGRGVASADANNDGRMQIAINTIGGRLVLLRPSGQLGHWLDVELTRFSPGAVVTAVLPNGKRVSREVTAGSSYLSSEDPRVHFGLGRATRVARLIVRFPSGTTTQVDRIAADRVVSVTAPVVRHTAPPAPSTAGFANCTPATHGRSVARIWNDAAVAALRVGNASEPVQARDLYQLSAAVARAYALAATSANRDAAISYAAYRLLVWQASFNANLAQSFMLLTKQLRALCFTQDFTSVSGPAAGLGNRVGAHAVDAGQSDGSNESLHFADPTFTPQNQPLIVAEAGSAVHDATFWQPLALTRVTPRGSSAVPAQVQAFVGSQWGSVRPFAGTVRVGAPRLGDPSGTAYRNAALAAIRATAEPSPAASVDPSPSGWNASLPSLGLRRDVKLDLALNGALNDAAVSAFAAKRSYDTPRPISMIRYLAFTGSLPTAAGLTRRVDGVVQVRRQGRWVRGDRWRPPVPTPASPGYPSADAAFASAAATVLGQSATARAAVAAGIGIRNGTELPLDVAAGRKAGIAAGTLARARAGW